MGHENSWSEGTVQWGAAFDAQTKVQGAERVALTAHHEQRLASEVKRARSLDLGRTAFSHHVKPKKTCTVRGSCRLPGSFPVASRELHMPLPGGPRPFDLGPEAVAVTL